jgi:hypothetical protein
MTDSNDDAKTGPRPYRVPPAEFRFVKGSSGNPKGRPGKTRELTSTTIGGKLGVGLEDPFMSLVLKEAFRIITVREGSRVEKLPVAQALLRKVFANAVNGNTRSQRIYVELTRQAAASRTTARTEVLYAAVEYKETWAVAFASYDRAGVDRPEPVPHPDDVNINYETGDVTITGPVMTEQKVARERLLAARSELEQNLTDCIKAMEADPDDLSLRRVRKKLTQIIAWLRRGAPFAG